MENKGYFICEVGKFGGNDQDDKLVLSFVLCDIIYRKEVGCVENGFKICSK